MINTFSFIQIKIRLNQKLYKVQAMANGPVCWKDKKNAKKARKYIKIEIIYNVFHKNHIK